MDASWKAAIWGQFGAAIDMLERAVIACPDELWGDRTRRPEFWYLVFHTLFWLDLYLTGRKEGFAPPAPYTLDELDPAGLFPDRVYTKQEMRAYLEHGRRKCRATIAALTDEQAADRSGAQGPEIGFGELLIYNLRHVQHHAAQLNLMLRQTIDSAPGWVGQTAKELEG
jgi:hypothetical protein